jgi:aspartyl/asparaginyl beta-hydroxylase (cupin superfamily)
MKNSLEKKIWEFPRDTEFTQICLLDDWTNPLDKWTTKFVHWTTGQVHWTTGQLNLSTRQLDLSTGQLDNFNEALQLIEA